MLRIVVIMFKTIIKIPIRFLAVNIKKSVIMPKILIENIFYQINIMLSLLIKSIN